MKVQLIKSTSSIDSAMKFLQERHNSYVSRQLAKPILMRNPMPQKISIFKDFLVLIGVLPIKCPRIK